MAIVANISEVYDILYDMKTEPAAKFLIFLTLNGLGLLTVVFVLGLERNTISELIFWSLIVFGSAIFLILFWFLSVKHANRSILSKYLAALKESGESVFVTKENTRVIFTSQLFIEMIEILGLKDLLGFDDLSLISKFVSPSSRKTFLRLKENSLLNKPISDELRLISANQEELIWSVSIRPIGSLQGLFVWKVVDITSQRNFENEISRERELIFDLLDNLPVGFFSADQNGKFQYLNQTLASWLNIDSGFQESGERVSLSEFLAVEQTGKLDSAVEVDSSGMHAGLNLRGGDGNVFEAYLLQSQNETPSGEFAYSRSIVLREPFTPVVDDGSGSQLLSRIPWLFSDSPVGLVILDLNGTVIDCNRSFLKILGLHRDGVVGRSISERISKEDRDSADAALSKVLMKIMRATLIEVSIPIDGERQITASLYVSRIENNLGDVTGLVVHVIDNTEQKNLEVQFNQAQKMHAVGQLAAGIAHDFNNLLTAMGGFCDLLLSRRESDAADKEDIMQIKENANRASKLVKNLLAFSRRQTLQPKIFSINDALQSLSTTLLGIIGENIEIDLRFEPGVDLIRTDPGQFDQVIINLAVNARDSMPGGGKIIIITELVTVDTAVQRGHDVMPAGEYIRINISDTGCGIAQENMTRIFEPFFSTKDVGEGTGLGLSTVYGIIRQSDGYIFVDSAVGEGTTFSIYLPAFSAAEVSAIGGEISSVEDVEVFDASDLRGEATVLLVEDEDAVRVFGSRALKNSGYRVLEAEDGETALDVINEYNEPIDLIITDVMMPGMDGHTLVKLVQEELPGIKVILMSGYAEDTIPGEISKDNSINFLSKPFSLSKLAAKVKEVMAA